MLKIKQQARKILQEIKKKLSTKIILDGVLQDSWGGKGSLETGDLREVWKSQELQVFEEFWSAQFCLQSTFI